MIRWMNTSEHLLNINMHCNAKKSQTFFNPVGLWPMNVFLFFPTIAYFLFSLHRVQHAQFITFSGHTYLVLNKLLLSTSVTPHLTWMSCDVNSTLLTSCLWLWISRLASSWPSGFTLRGHPCCVFDCYPKSWGLWPSVTDWYLAWSPATTHPSSINIKSLLCKWLHL